MSPFRLKELRDLFVIVIHPADEEGKALVDQLSRIGCRTELIWPPSSNIPPSVDVVFAGVFFETHEKLKSMLKKMKNPAPTVLAIVNYENPAMLQNVLEIDALAVISKPVRSFGMMTNLVLARSNWHQINELQTKSRRLEKKIEIGTQQYSCCEMKRFYYIILYTRVPGIPGSPTDRPQTALQRRRQR